MSSTIIAPPSTPTYHDLSRASEGEARTVEASASATASFRIIIPFLGCHYGQPQLPTPGLVSAQANKFRLLLPKRNKSESLERSEEHTSELQSLMRISYAVFCLKKKKHK